MTQFDVLWRSILFVVVNCVQPLLMDEINKNGGGEKSTLLYIMPTYIAMVLVGFAPIGSASARKPGEKARSLTSYSLKCWMKAAFVASTDLAHQGLEKAGLLLAGSAVYIVVNSSSIVWTAIMSIALMGKGQSKFQWIGIFSICCGLALRGFMVEMSLKNSEFVGIVCILGAAVLHGISYVLNEKFMTIEDETRIDGPDLTMMMGLMSSVTLIGWTLIHTIPQWQALVVDKIEEKGGNPMVVLGCYLALLLAAYLRSNTLWWLVKNLGAVTTGVLKGLRTATVFLFAHLFYCSAIPNNCLTPLKTVSMLLCVFGAFVYGYKPKRAGSIQKQWSDTSVGSLQSNMILKRERSRAQEQQQNYGAANPNEGLSKHAEAV
uniref:Sugar phosphate transporter domain-containing protein n=1 Tax=Chromera velia CCMP2878 TaxID=1169474 RepID=A0A0G4HLK0_9ALVE|eukprot:Cvel_28790.t1-p1 / transcript=Cvel_28790.t1 / gene=Cvel_28790 / organism=Chromera_velia_CCMP2878 / gene_product=hypothetical protein / transcript_product=hypothetical protein / location=Cvel_scaffold3833:8893-12710(+) / protein_length=375 / sequence_SO=supercontig / SO=protein_coding / is_pseudo=false